MGLGSPIIAKTWTQDLFDIIYDTGTHFKCLQDFFIFTRLLTGVIIQSINGSEADTCL